MAVLLDQIPADAAPAPLADAVARAEAGIERVILTRGGRPVAAVVPIADLEAIEDAEDATIAARLLAEWEAEGRPAGILLDDIARDLGIDLTGDPDTAS